MKDLYRGTLVRLSSFSADELAKAFARWDRDSFLHRLADTDPAQLRSEKKLKESLERREKDTRGRHFSLRTLAEDKLIGVIGLIPNDARDDAWLYIAIYEEDYLGKGCGTDGMRLITQYGFLELGLRRISLGLNSYNERALRAYQKVGFQPEGGIRGEVLKDGKRYDGLFMGVLREEWFAQREAQ